MIHPPPAKLLRLLFPVLLLGLLALHVSNALPVHFIRILDTYIYDEKVRRTLKPLAEAPVVIVDIDERSLAAEGRWPWSRDKMTRLVEQLTDHYQANAIGFDIVFAEADTSSGIDTLRRLATDDLRGHAPYARALEKLLPELDYDRRFAAALLARPVAMGYYFTGERGSEATSTGVLPPAVFGQSARYASVPLYEWANYGGNLPVIGEAAPIGGFINFIGDFDGNARRVPLLARHQGEIYDALPLAVLRTALGGSIQLGFGEAIGEAPPQLEQIIFRSPYGNLAIPVNEQAAALIPFYGPAKTFRYISATDILHGRTPVEPLQGRIVLVGTSAPGLLDLRSTPVDKVFPGVEIHASLITGILNGELRERPDFVVGLELVLLLVLGIVLLAILPRLGPASSSAFILLVLGLLAGINLATWHQGWVLHLGPQLILLATMYLYQMAWGYFSEYRHKKYFADLFGLYVPPELVAEMAKSPKQYSMEGRNAELTVLFSDVRDFTSISERLPPDELARLMNVYLDRMTHIILERRGTVDKYIGDAIMAFWGAPVADPEHARHAVLAALDMLSAQQALAREFEQRNWPVLKIGIGISTGNMTVGDMGSSLRKAYTVMGDAVNLGARLEGLTKAYGLQLLIAESTRQAIPGLIVREVDLVRVKGKDVPVAIHEPVGMADRVSPAEQERATRWNAFIHAYRSQDWPRAETRLQAIRADHDDRLAAIYAERLATLKAEPPGPDWDGVVKFTTK